VIALALYRHQSIPEVVAHLDLTLPDEVNPDIAKSALTQARQRLGRAPLAQLFAMSTSCWDERHQAGKTWRGLARYSVDGSTLRTSDSAENRAHFWRAGLSRRPGSELSAGTPSHVDCPCQDAGCAISTRA